MEVLHVQQGKKIRLAQPQQFMAQDREIVEEAYAGDVIGDVYKRQALVFLLTLPNIQQKEKIIRKKGCEALIEVVNAQILLYEVCLLYTSLWMASF